MVVCEKGVLNVCEKGEYRMGLSTHPSGVLVFRGSMEDANSMTVSWGLPVRTKFVIGTKLN